MSPRFAEPANLEANKAKVPGVERVAHRLCATPAQEALAWLHAKGPNVFPIPGSVNPARIAENVTATSLRLALEDVAELDAIGEGPGEVRRRRRRRAAAAEAAHPTEDRQGARGKGWRRAVSFIPTMKPDTRPPACRVAVGVGRGVLRETKAHRVCTVRYHLSTTTPRPDTLAGRLCAYL